MTEKEEREKELDDALLDILNKGLIQVSENEDGSKGFLLNTSVVPPSPTD